MYGSLPIIVGGHKKVITLWLHKLQDKYALQPADTFIFINSEKKNPSRKSRLIQLDITQNVP